jgi:hypothetical protein
VISLRFKLLGSEKLLPELVYPYMAARSWTDLNLL